MKTQLNTLIRTLRSKVFGFFVLCMVMGVAIGLTPNASFAQTSAPDAGTTIGNQASATYTDNGGTSRTVTSNTVETTVQQVAAVTLTQGQTKSVSPGGTVTFAHTLTNNGNGTDTFNLTAVDAEQGNFDFVNIQIYEDADGNGQADDLNDPITISDAVAAGDDYSFVVIADIPTGAVDGDNEFVNVTTQSQFNNGVSDSDANDQALIAENAVVNVSKTFSSNTGDVSDVVTVTITYTNNGNSDATNLSITDELEENGFDYQAGTAAVNGSAVTDADDTDGFQFVAPAAGDNGTAILNVATLATGQQSTLTFDVAIAMGTEGDQIPNTADYNHDDLNNEQQSNTANFNVNENFAVATVDTVNADDDVIEVGPVDQGATVNFVNVFQNNGSTQDRFEITFSGQSNYPAGTTFTLFSTDGNGNPTSTITTDTDSDGNVETGNIAAGDQFAVIMQVQLPSDATGGPFDLTKTATSVNDANASATFTDRLTAITASTVDVTNDESLSTNASAAGAGVNPNGEATAVTTNSAAPGTSTSFELHVNNTSNVSDNYSLTAGTLNGGTFTAGVPSGFSVEFQNSSGGTITNTGSIPSGGSIEVTAVVSVDEGTAPGAQSIYFRARSSASGAADVKHDAVDVDAVRDLTLVANSSGQIAPGGTVVYNHTLTNEGNVVENNGTNSALQFSLNNTQPGFQASVFYDGDGDGQINTSGSDSLITSASAGAVTIPTGALNNGDQIQLIVRVTATAGVNDGTSNTTTLTVQDDGTGQAVGGVPTSNLTVSVNDITTVVAGNIVITKRQMNVTQSGSFTQGNVNANPGDVIRYQLVVTNNGSSQVTNLEVTDNTPSFTTLEAQATATGDVTPTFTQPANGNDGTVIANIGTLGPGQTVTITFDVEIDS